MIVKTESAQALVARRVDSVMEVGELAKLGVQLGYDVKVSDGYDEDGQREGSIITFIRDEDDAVVDLERNLIGAVLFKALAEGRSVNRVLESIRSRIADLHAPLDRPLQDVMEIGMGHRDDELT